MFPEVMEAVVGRRFPFRYGVVRGYAQFSLNDMPRAAMVPFPDTATEGIVYSDVDEAALHDMDAFVGPDFVRAEVNVEAENGEWLEAEAFVLRIRAKKRLTAQPWDEEEFRRKHLKQVLKEHGRRSPAS